MKSFRINKIPSVPHMLNLDSWEYDSTIVNSFSDSTIGEGASSSNPCLSNLSMPEDDDVPRQQEYVYVIVSGVSFLLQPEIFARLKTLPWNREPNLSYSLQTSPVLFEIILNYLLFESLPDCKDLSKHDLEELEPMVMLLELDVLEQHLQPPKRGQSWRMMMTRNNQTSVVDQHLLGSSAKMREKTPATLRFFKTRPRVKRWNTAQHHEFVSKSECVA
jgi:hypothetical protein